MIDHSRKMDRITNSAEKNVCAYGLKQTKIFEARKKENSGGTENGRLARSCADLRRFFLPSTKIVACF
jgi:hypothetical protein